MHYNKTIGKYGETIAADYLINNGYKILDRNFQTRYGEVDIIGVKEARERVRAAIVNSGYTFPLGRIIINLAPADVRKRGTFLDLPIAIGILMASGQIKYKELDDFIIFGELSLSGDLKGINHH